MAITVEVAVLGNPAKAFTAEAFGWSEGGGAPELEGRWEDRPRGTLDVEEDELLTDVMQRAADALGIAPAEGRALAESVSFIGFHNPDEPLTWRAITSHLILVDDDGRALFNVWDFGKVTYGEILRAGEAGTLHGNPHRPYLVLAPAMGNGILPNWAEILLALKLTWDVMDALSRAEGTWAFASHVLRAARDRIGQGREAIERRHIPWEERGGTPYEISELLGLGPWHEGDLAVRLECDPQDAKAILWSYGYEKAASGLWRRDEDEPARVLHRLVDDLPLARGITGGGEYRSWGRVVTERARAYLETGELPPEPEVPRDEETSVDERPYEFGPIHNLQVACECGDEACQVVLEMYWRYEDQTRVNLHFSEETDHFVIAPVALGALLGHLAG